MRSFRRPVRVGLLLLVSGAWLMQWGCLSTIQQELEFLYAPVANLSGLSNSVLLNWLGPNLYSFLI